MDYSKETGVNAASLLEKLELVADLKEPAYEKKKKDMSDDDKFILKLICRAILDKNQAFRDYTCYQAFWRNNVQEKAKTWMNVKELESVMTKLV